VFLLVGRDDELTARSFSGHGGGHRRKLQTGSFAIAAVVALAGFSPGCASQEESSPVAEDLYVIDHDGEFPSASEVRPYQTEVARIATTCRKSEDDVGDMAVGAADLLLANTGKEWSLLELLSGFDPVPPEEINTTCTEQFGVYTFALGGGG
jgi:hypothetical protein